MNKRTRDQRVALREHAKNGNQAVAEKYEAKTARSAKRARASSAKRNSRPEDHRANAESEAAKERRREDHARQEQYRRFDLIYA